MSTRMRLELSCSVHADGGVQVNVEAGILDQSRQHGGAAMRQDGQLVTAQALQLAERILGLGIGIEVEIFVEQRLGHAVICLDSNRAQRELERSVRQKGEITVVLQRSLEPGIFKLFQSPELGDEITLA